MDRLEVEEKKRQKERDELVDHVRAQEKSDIKTVLSTASGQRFVWRLLEYCSTFSSVFNENQLWMANNSGKQDVGHFIMSEIGKADERLLFKMMKANMHKGEENG